MKAAGSSIRVRRAWLALGLAIVSVAARGAVPSGRRQRALAAFDKAQQMRVALEARQSGKRSKDEYKKVIAAYYDVYRLNPNSSKATPALTIVGDLYREMGREFTSDTYYWEAIKSYQSLIKQYPHSRLGREAQFTVAEVYRQDLEDPENARKAYQDFIAANPQSSHVDEAREMLARLDDNPAEKSAPPKVAAPKRSTTLSTTAPSSVPASSASSSVPATAIETVAETSSSGIRQVTALRHWVGPNYLRIVIEVGGEAKFDSVRLAKPDRIVIDLQKTRLSKELVGKTFPVENGYLRQVRVAQYTAEVTRVVLDVEKIDSYSIFSLPNPFRLVIDVQGTSPTQMARTTKPAAPNPVGSRTAKPGQSAEAQPLDTAPTLEVKQPEANKAEEDKTEANKTEGEASKSSKTGKERTKPPKRDTALPTTAPEVAEQPSGSVSAAVNPPKSKATDKAEVAPLGINPGAASDSASRTLTRALGLKIGRIVIDPGHGGHDTGTIGPTGLEEKNVVLDVGLKLRALLQQYTGCEVVMTRSDDTFIPLEERTAIANQKSADLFISIHANASRDTSARGIETYYLNFTSSPDALEVAARENSTSQQAVHQLQDLIKQIALTEKIQESQEFARQVQREVYGRVTRVSGAQRDRGTKKAPFVVLIGANMPSVLAEISFLTNPRDERLLRRSDYREKIASALYEGILSYVKNLGEVVRTAQRNAPDQSTSSVGQIF